MLVCGCAEIEWVANAPPAFSFKRDPLEWMRGRAPACLTALFDMPSTGGGPLPAPEPAKSRTEYLRKENLKAVRRETATFKRFRKLVDQWADQALKLSRLKTRLGLHSDPP